MCFRDKSENKCCNAFFEVKPCTYNSSTALLANWAKINCCQLMCGYEIKSPHQISVTRQHSHFISTASIFQIKWSQQTCISYTKTFMSYQFPFSLSAILYSISLYYLITLPYPLFLLLVFWRSALSRIYLLARPSKLQATLCFCTNQHVHSSFNSKWPCIVEEQLFVLNQII